MAGLVSDATREQIRAANDIVDVIGSYLPLKRSGANFMALCPFHKEKTPSFNVNPHLQIFKCFGCQKGGDVFTFVMEYESIDFPEALKRLADRASIPLEYERGGVEQQTRHLKDSLLQIHEQITARWQSALANEASGQIARDYLLKRGVSEEAAKLFRLGFAPEVWDDTVNWAKSKGHEHDLVEKAGLILKKEGSDHYYDRFRGRLIFPICDEQGRVIGFSGRILSGDEKAAKYVNSPETAIFTKSKVFFGLDKSKRAVLDAGYAIVCEGQLDLIACFMGGVQNIVAPQGTAFTPDHARILKRYVDEVVLCFDSDKAGQNAAVRALDSLLASGLAIKVATVPSPHDPDSFIKEFGGDAFRKVIEGAEGYFDYFLTRLCVVNDVASDKGRLTVLREMAEAIHKTGNVVLIDKYAQKTALRLGVNPDAVRAEFKKLGRNQKSSATATETEIAQADLADVPVPALEKWLLRIMLTNDDLVPWIAERLQVDWLRHAGVKKIAAARIASLRADAWNGVAAFLAQHEDEAAKQLITDVVSENKAVVDPERLLKGDPLHTDKRGILERLRDEALDAEMTAVKQRKNHPEISEDEHTALLRRLVELRLLRKQPLSAYRDPGRLTLRPDQSRRG